MILSFFSPKVYIDTQGLQIFIVTDSVLGNSEQELTTLLSTVFTLDVKYFLGVAYMSKRNREI